MPDKRKNKTWNQKMAQLRKSRLLARKGLEEGFRSGLEEKAAGMIEDAGLEVHFEEDVIPWQDIPKLHKYHPDFTITTKRSKKTIYIETKGRFMPKDKAKHLAIKLQSPTVDVRFVFQSRSYDSWARRYGFTFCHISEFPQKLKEWSAE